MVNMLTLSGDSFTPKSKMAPKTGSSVMLARVVVSERYLSRLLCFPARQIDATIFIQPTIHLDATFYKWLCYGRGTARGTCQQKSCNYKTSHPIVWHYLRDSTFSRFDTIPDCDRHTHTQSACKRTDTRRQHIPHLAQRRRIKIDHIARPTNYYQGLPLQATSDGRQQNVRLLSPI